MQASEENVVDNGSETLRHTHAKVCKEIGEICLPEIRFSEHNIIHGNPFLKGFVVSKW